MPDDTTRQTEPTPCERDVHAADRTVFALAIVLALFSTAALAQSARTFYGVDGRVLLPLDHRRTCDHLLRCRRSRDWPHVQRRRHHDDLGADGLVL